jgi:hypothetical protein
MAVLLRACAAFIDDMDVSGVAACCAPYLADVTLNSAISSVGTRSAWQRVLSDTNHKPAEISHQVRLSGRTAWLAGRWVSVR